MFEKTLSRRELTAGAVGLAGAVIVSPVFAQQATPVAPSEQPAGATPVSPSSSAWPLYGHDLSGAKSTADAGIDSTNVSSLAEAWRVEVKGPVSATPVIADGVAFVGSYDGALYAIELASGTVLWTYETGAAVMEPNLQIPLGITGSAAVIDGIVYVGDASAAVHAVDANSGSQIWKATVDDQPNASIWSSPVISGDRLFIGVASVAKQEGFRGSVVALDRASGEIGWQTYMVPEGKDGAGVFAVPAIDEERGLLFVGTQNAYSATPAPYGNPTSVVALDLTTGDLKWVFTPPESLSDPAPTDDVGFSASPNLFSAELEGETRDLVGVGQKSGDFWALDRENGELIWQTTVSPAGFLGGMEGTSAVANGVIAVPATNWTDFEGSATGMVTALDAATGATKWSVAQDAPAASPAAISNDVVVHAGLDGVLHGYALEGGAELLTIDLGASVSGGIAVADGTVVIGAATPMFAPFIRAGSSIVGLRVP
jgi:polyvinyl alcohol dehydrogenase (cytochrome)